MLTMHSMVRGKLIKNARCGNTAAIYEAASGLIPQHPTLFFDSTSANRSLANRHSMHREKIVDHFSTLRSFFS
jgi:hypothetical protein